MIYLELNEEEFKEIMDGLECIKLERCRSHKEHDEVQQVIDHVQRQVVDQKDTKVTGFST